MQIIRWTNTLTPRMVSDFHFCKQRKTIARATKHYLIWDKSLQYTNSILEQP